MGFVGNFNRAVAAAKEAAAARETVKADESVAVGLRRGRVVRERGRRTGGLDAGDFDDIPSTGGHPHAAGSGCNHLMFGAGHVVRRIFYINSLM